jgi:hypothetical protein
MSGGASGGGLSGPWALIVALVGFFLMIVLLVGGAVALRLGPFARPPGTPLITPSLSLAPTPTAEPPPVTGQPSAATPGQPSAGQSTPSTPTQTPKLPRPTFDSPLAELLSHVPEALLASCQPTGPDTSVLAGIECSIDDRSISVRYFLYESNDNVHQTYDAMFRTAQIDADSGRCYDVDGQTISATPNKWPAEHAYSIDQQPVGRYLCFEVRDGFDVYWTDERFAIIGIAQASGDNLDRLVRFWLNEAGPVP